MSSWERIGETDEWYTPQHIFDALGERFDLDVAAPIEGGPHVPADDWISSDSLSKPWRGFVWMNPPFGGRNALLPWVQRLLDHSGGGLGLVPDRTSAPWFAPIALRSDAILFTAGKIKFHRPDGSLGKSPGNGTAIFAVGNRAVAALHRAAPSLGYVLTPAANDNRASR
jgi:hypothetical protein